MTDALAWDAALIGARARAAQKAAAAAAPDARSRAIAAMAGAIRHSAAAILKANADDVAEARREKRSDSYVDRLALDASRLEAVAAGVEAVARLPDPVGRVLADWTRPNGLRIRRVSVPIGVIGMIFESRPNVAADASALALRAGNAVILRGGADSAGCVAAIVVALSQGLASSGFDPHTVQAAPTADRRFVGAMLAGLDGAIDVVAPRGGRDLVERVRREARIPVFAHLEGVCHTYVHAAADPDRAVALVVNAKMRRTGVCGATETLLVDRAAAGRLLPRIAEALVAQGCALRGDAEARAIAPMEAATDDDWRTEYLAPILAVRVVAGIDQAIDHIARYGTQHTECIVTEDADAAAAFQQKVDSAIVLWNASTQFADGGEFGFGGELGISTGRLHARGPIGAEQLTTFKYLVDGSGQVRP